jgi:uncharacterized membrane protein YkoI
MLCWRSSSLLRFCRIGALCGVLVAALVPHSAHADSDQDRARKAVEQGQVLPLNAVLKSIRHQCKGRVLDAQLFPGGRGWVYRVRVLARDGQVADIVLDAQSGQIMGMSGACS